MMRHDRCLLPPSPVLCRAPARALVSLVFFALLVCVSGGNVPAQSGRRAPKSSTPLPTPTETSTGVSESNSKPANQSAKPLLSLAVFEFDDPFLETFLTSRIALDGFLNRLKDAPDVSVVIGGKITRKDAAARAKNETEAHVVVLQLEESAAVGGRETIGRVDPATLVVKYYVYAPTSGTLKYVGRVEQRPYQQAARVGGVRIPLPSPVPRGRVASEWTLEQAARDAAEEVLARFQIRLPPDRQ